MFTLTPSFVIARNCTFPYFTQQRPGRDALETTYFGFLPILSPCLLCSNFMHRLLNCSRKHERHPDSRNYSSVFNYDYVIGSFCFTLERHSSILMSDKVCARVRDDAKSFPYGVLYDLFKKAELHVLIPVIYGHRMGGFGRGPYAFVSTFYSESK